MLQRLDSPRDADIVADMAVEVVRRGEPLTMRAIARERRVNPSTLVKRYGSLERLTQVVLETMAVRWLQALQPRWERAIRTSPEATSCGLVTFLPDVAGLGPDRSSHDDRLDLGDLRIFITFLDLAASDDATATIHDWVRNEERLCLTDSVVALTGSAPPQTVIDVLHATIDGLRHRLVARSAPMPLEDALSAWTLTIDTLIRPVHHEQVA